MWDWLWTLLDWIAAAGPYIWAAMAWSILFCGAAGGLVGVFVPIIPGAFVLLGAAIVHKWMLAGYLSWWTILGLVALVVLDRVVDFVGTALGTKWFGGTKWGVIGAIAGGVFGLLFGIFGILIGPVVGAFVFEIIAAKSRPEKAAKAGMGAGVGFGISAMGRLLICFAMLAAILLDLIISGDEEELAEPGQVSEEAALEITSG